MRGERGVGAPRRRVFADPLADDQHARGEVRVVVVGLFGEDEEGEPAARRNLLVHALVDRDSAQSIE